jgi:hypothetical protein
MTTRFKRYHPRAASGPRPLVTPGGPSRRVAGWLVAAMLALSAGPAPAGMMPGQPGDGVADLYVGGRDLVLHADGGGAINGFVLTSQAGLLSGEPYAFAQGLFVTDGDYMVADQFGYAQAGTHDLGRVLAAAADLATLGQDLSLTYTVAGESGVRHATILPAHPGDCDLDWVVGRLDLARVGQSFSLPGGAVWVDGDFTGDGLVNWMDYITLKSNYGWAGLPAGTVPVPEPATLALLAALAAGGMRPAGRPPTSRRSRRTA